MVRQWVSTTRSIHQKRYRLLIINKISPHVNFAASNWQAVYDISSQNNFHRFYHHFRGWVIDLRSCAILRRPNHWSSNCWFRRLWCLLRCFHNRCSCCASLSAPTICSPRQCYLRFGFSHWSFIRRRIHREAVLALVLLHQFTVGIFLIHQTTDCTDDLID